MSVDPKTILKRFARRRHDVLGFDVGVTTLKAVRLRVIENAVYLVAVAQLPHLSVPTANSESSAAPQPFQIPRSLHAKYVAFALSPPQAVAKLLVVPRPADKLDDFSFAGLLGLDNPDAFRIGVEIASSTHSETTVLASAMPDQVVHWALGLFPIATPAPCSLEISGLAALNAVAYGLKDHPRDEAVMAIDIGAQTSTLGVFLRGDLALLRQFKLGASAILSHVANDLGMDEETARGILADNVVDATDAIHTALQPLVRQLALGRDFVTRHRNCRIGDLYLTGGIAGTPFWRQHLAALLGFEAKEWNPLAVVPPHPDLPPAEQTTDTGCFAAAMGAALGALEMS